MRRSLAAILLAGVVAAVPACVQPARAAPSTKPSAAVEPGRRLPPGYEKGAYLGVAASPAPAVLRQQLGLPKGVGLTVDAVAPDSPAAAAGLRQYDVLHRLDDQLLVNPQQLAVLVRTLRPDGRVRLAIYRDGKPTELTAALAERALPPLDQMRLGMFIDPLAVTGGSQDDPAPSGDGVSLRWEDEQVDMTLTVRAGKAHLLAKDKAGKPLYDGPVDTDAERQATPPAVRDRLPHFGPPGTFGKRAGNGGTSTPDRPNSPPATGPNP